MKASEVMTKRVISIDPEASIVQAAATMLRNRISGLPVVNRAGKLVGVITEGDFLHRGEIGTEVRRRAWLDAFFGPEQSANDYVRAHGIKVKELMAGSPITVTEEASLNQVVALMERQRIKRLPVVRGTKLVGIISRANLMQALASIHRSHSKSSTTDQETRKRIVEALQKQPWSIGADVFVLVRNGIVDLCGTLTDASQRAALRALAEGQPGVRQVYDHLILPNDGVSVS